MKPNNLSPTIATAALLLAACGVSDDGAADDTADVSAMTTSISPPERTTVTPRRPCRPTAPYLAASVVKTFVAATALQLVDEGRLSLDEPVERWLPGSCRADRRAPTRRRSGRSHR